MGSGGGGQWNTESTAAGPGGHHQPMTSPQQQQPQGEVQPLVRRAVDHADTLVDIANSIDANFDEARNRARDPIAAATAFRSIVDAVVAAEDALAVTQEAVENATKDVATLYFSHHTI